MNRSDNSKKVRILAFMAMMLAVMMVLSIIERMLPPLVPMAPSVRLGLANVMTMYALIFLGKRQAMTLTAMKSLFITLLRGPMAGFVSLVAGSLSLFVIICLMFITRRKASFIMLSVGGALAHNFAQLPVISIFPGSPPLNLLMRTSWPLLLIFGAIFGVITGILLKIVMPHMNRIFAVNKEQKREKLPQWQFLVTLAIPIVVAAIIAVVAMSMLREPTFDDLPEWLDFSYIGGVHGV